MDPGSSTSCSRKALASSQQEEKRSWRLFLSLEPGIAHVTSAYIVLARKWSPAPATWKELGNKLQLWVPEENSCFGHQLENSTTLASNLASSLAVIWIIFQMLHKWSLKELNLFKCFSVYSLQRFPLNLERSSLLFMDADMQYLFHLILNSQPYFLPSSPSLIMLNIWPNFRQAVLSCLWALKLDLLFTNSLP